MSAEVTNNMRRLLAHLSIPRSRAGLAARLQEDQYFDVEADVGRLLKRAESEGLVVNLGEHDPESAVKAVGSNDDAIDFGKGQAKSWRNLAEHGRYQLDGDLFILSKEGLKALRGDTEGDDA